MSYYVTNFNKIRQNKSILKTLKALERGFVKHGIDFYLIGAVAREVWMRGLKDITPRRATSDIDFAVLIKDSKHFDELKLYLVRVEGFTSIRNNEFVLIAPDKMQIDILPFGTIEKAGKVTVKGTGLTSINMEGMKEIYEEGIPEVTFENEISFKVCTLPAIVLLKLIAWDDRPDIRVSDLNDIADILHHFFNIYDEIIWNEHNDLFDEHKELINISARVLGREMGKILRRNQLLKARIIAILDENENSKSQKIATYFAIELQGTLEESLVLINEILLGIKEII